VALVFAACSGGGSSASSAGRLLVVVNAPFSRDSYIGSTIAHGVELAVRKVNAKGGVDAGGVRYRLAIQRLDNVQSPQQAAANVQKAVAEHAVAIVDEGTGIDASWQIAARAHVPICIVYQGGLGLVDPKTRPNVFRIAPTDHGIAFRLAEYLIPKGLKVAFLHDDSDYGQQGSRAFDVAFGRNRSSVAANIGVSAGGLNVQPQILQARSSGATALLMWGSSATIAEVVRSARQSGWDVPIYTPAAGEDPLVRSLLADEPSWVDGLTFATGRMTAERGSGPFLTFMRSYTRAFGPDPVGVRTAEGQTVIQPPDEAMYSYDFVNVLAAAVAAAHGPTGRAVIAALNQVDVRGANGDERGFNELNHEGVVDDDIYFASFHDMTFAPVKDDPLSSTLPVIPQTLANATP
jgi:branched-chain amino acid transport system substrate-binding protein